MEDVNSARRRLLVYGANRQMRNLKTKNRYGIKNLTGKSFIFLCLIIIWSLFFHYELKGSYLLYAGNIKNPGFAGTFYPDDPKKLSKIVDDFLDNVDPKPLNGEIFGLICPHAGYDFSGKVAANGYKLIKGKPYKIVVILGTSHRYPFSGASVYPEGVFNTPLGEIKVDSEFTKKILNKDPEVYFIPEAFKSEHSIEVQLPFLQRVLTEFKIVPIVLGDCSFSCCQRIAALLKEAIGERKDVLVIASTDMYHGYDYDEATKVDNLTLGAIKNMDAQGLYYGLREEKMQMCGGFGVVTELILARELKHNMVKVLRQTNSAEVTARKIKGIWTVGYTSCAIDEPRAGLNPAGVKQTSGKEKNMLNTVQRKRLLEIARSTIETYLKTGKKPQVNENDPILIKVMGAFVTLNERGQLRGCIGNLIGTEPLYLTVSNMAVEAATSDPRFNPLELSELKDIEIEISVLSPMERIDTPDKIKLGTHGVLVRRGFRSGVFLPQVATETGWSKEEFMSNLCAHKAGLAADAWKDKSTEIYIFSAEVFSEKETSSD